MTMTEEQLYQLRCFYAYRQKAYVRSLLVERLKEARTLLEVARNLYNQYPVKRNAKYLENCQANVTRFENQISELDSIGVYQYVRRTEHSERTNRH